MRAVEGPEHRDVGRLRLHRVPDGLVDIGGRQPIGLRQFQVFFHQREFRGLRFVHKEFERRDHRLHRASVFQDLAKEMLVSRQPLRIHFVGPVVHREFQKHQVRLVFQHVALQPEDAQIGAGSADGRVKKREVRLRVFRREILHHQPSVARGERVARGGAPGQGAAEKDDVEAGAFFGPLVEGLEGCWFFGHGSAGDRRERECGADHRKKKFGAGHKTGSGMAGGREG